MAHRAILHRLRTRITLSGAQEGEPAAKGLEWIHPGEGRNQISRLVRFGSVLIAPLRRNLLPALAR